MDWNLKAPSWDLSELEQGAFPNIETVSGSSSFGDHRAQRGDFSVDCKSFYLLFFLATHAELDSGMQGKVHLKL